MTGRSERERRIGLVLDHLASVGEDDAVGVEEVAAATGIGDAVLPLLADLVRRGWLAHDYQVRSDARRLCYRLTPEGREALAPRRP
jgi:DNA-binding MarR family transcriptional regulator